MKILALAILMCTCAVAPLWAEEPPLKELELRLQVVQAQKQAAAGDFERGQLLIQNSQMRFKALSDEEAALQAKIVKAKAEAQGEKK